MKLVGLIGEPAAGKSTVMKSLVSKLGQSEIVKEGLVVYTVYAADKVIIAGKYEDGVIFCGTDTLSKGCGPKYRDWLREKNDDPSFADYTFYWEGERFSNSKFFDFFFQECPDSTVYFLQADPAVLDDRNKNRSNQNPTWRKGMTTRLNNLRNAYSVKLVNQDFSFS